MQDNINMEVSKLSKKKLFNPYGLEDVKIIGGDVTNLLNLSYPKYPKYYKFVEIGETNQWKPQKTEMSLDKIQYTKNLSTNEKKAFDELLSFLVYLDSLLTNQLPNLCDYTTSPDAVYFFTRQAYEEANHSMSYGWILQSLMSQEKANDIVFKWKYNPLMFARVSYIANIYQEFTDNATDKGYLRCVVGNILLEGLYFYNTFQFFHNLASRGLMIGTDTQFKYIQRDELNHCNAFIYHYKNLREENKKLIEDNIDMIYIMFNEAVEQEISFVVDIIGDGILGMTSYSCTNNTYYLANKRLRQMGLKQIFPKVENPYPHLDKQSGVDSETSNRTNNFESNGIQYKTPDIFTGWEDIYNPQEDELS